MGQGWGAETDLGKVHGDDKKQSEHQDSIESNHPKTETFTQKNTDCDINKCKQVDLAHH